MVSAASSSPACRVARHRAVYRLPRGHPAPAVARARLDRIVEGRLSGLASRLLATALDPRDPRVWLVRRLDVDLTVDLGAVDDEALARAWARRLAGGVGRLLAAGPDGDGVLCFDDRAAYLARFAADRAAGRADGRWYYRAFESLSALPPGAAVREALAREPEEIAAVLTRLAADGEIARVIAVLGPADAERVLAAMARAAGSATGSGGSGRGRFEALLDAWRRLGDPLGGSARGGRAAAALLLFATAAAHGPEVAADPGLAAAAETLIDLARLLRAGDPGTLCDRLAAGDLSALAAALRGRGVDDALAALPALARLARPAGGDAGWLRAMAEVVAPGERPAPGTAAPRIVSTPFAGVFFLLPSYLALGLDDALGRDPALRRRVLACCFGAARAAEAEADPALALASEAAGPPEETRTPDAGELVEALRHALIEARRADGREVVAERIEAEPRDLVVVRDIAADYWLALTPAEGPSPVPANGELPPEAGARLRRFRERAKPAAEELAWLARPARGAPAGDPETELAVALYARAVLRHFAGRLMGFEWSGGEHLYRNFLAGTGSVTITADGLDVRLPASPLRLVARMAGAHGMSYELPWHPCRKGCRRVTLELPEG